MVVSARSRSWPAFFAEEESGGSNDNPPAFLPGHEMPELRNAPRQPAGEASIHYTRFAQIECFPEHPHGPKAGAADAPPMDQCAIERQDAPKLRKRNVAVSCLTSVAFHAILFTALAVGLVVTPHEPEEEAGETVSVVILGDSEADQASAGGPDLQVEPQPEEVVAETVQPSEVQPERADPVEAEPLRPVQDVTRASAETVTTTEPEVLTSNVPTETSVIQPMATKIPEEVKPLDPVKTAEALPEPVQPEEMPTPAPKPKAAQLVEKPKAEKKEPRKKVEKKISGSQGESKRDSKRGANDGEETATSNRNSRSAGGSDGAGSAAVANYPGKVRARINRGVKVPNEYKRMGRAMSVRVKLTISANGSLAGLSVTQSSGFLELDQDVAADIRRLSPFPPLPTEWSKPTWTFDVGVQVTAR
jgi:protein TonB